MRQTAVEWLREKLWKEFNFIFSDNILDQAKEMEKAQIKDAWINSLTKGDYNSADEYYNETFKSE